MGHRPISSDSEMHRFFTQPGRLRREKHCLGFIQNDSGGVDAIVVMDRLGVPKISIKNCPYSSQKKA